MVLGLELMERRAMELMVMAFSGRSGWSLYPLSVFNLDVLAIRFHFPPRSCEYLKMSGHWTVTLHNASLKHLTTSLIQPWGCVSRSDFDPMMRTDAVL